MFVGILQLSFILPSLAGTIGIIVAGIGAIGILATAGRESRSPVSYTHLDVYKRQVLKTLVVDMVIESINLSKFFTVITSNTEPIVQYLNETLKRGATIEVAEGSYSHQKRYIILTATRRHQAVALRAYARQMDPHAFIMITNSSEIIGKGFSEH